MNNARLKQRGCVVAVLDLQNHCVKSVRIRSISGPYFPSFALKTMGYGVSFSIQSECGKISTSKYGHFSSSERFWRGHNLLIEPLKVHHIPAEMIQLITSQYSDYDISFLTDNFMTSTIKVQRLVLQGTVYHLYSFIINTVKFKKQNAWKMYTKVVCHQNIDFNLLMIPP